MEDSYSLAEPHDIWAKSLKRFVRARRWYAVKPAKNTSEYMQKQAHTQRQVNCVN